ncbi:chemotaxis protein CheB [Rufibacter quisquiliarum]|uniref:protein-glutamate methylesterase n=1 Tax=Rufibacter quisquiliarum TaxID=1549639 RepID=A0A839GT70_9BACT|nr:two-component system chemotaxis response regulator CheB [Rufibacter quisquiliarum]
MPLTPTRKIRVLIGDASVRSRLVLLGMINADPNLEVVDTAQSRDELLTKAMSYQPDVIVTHSGLTLSGHLPSFTSVLTTESSLLLLVSAEMALQSHPASNVKAFQESEPEAVRNGKKRPGYKEELMAKLKEFGGRFTGSQNGLRKVKRKEHFSMPTSTSAVDLFSYSALDKPLCLVVIGASTGGSKAVEYLIRELEVVQPTAVLVALHMPEKFTKRLARRLQKLTHWRVEEGYEGMAVTPQTIIIAPGGMDMLVRRTPLRPNRLFLEIMPATAVESPSVDLLMQSAAACARAQVLGVIMTGMGKDGSAGACAIQENGGVVIAQNEETSSIFGMAKNAIERGVVNGVFPLGQINAIINRFVSDRHLSHGLYCNLTG